MEQKSQMTALDNVMAVRQYLTIEVCCVVEQHLKDIATWDAAALRWYLPRSKNGLYPQLAALADPEVFVKCARMSVGDPKSYTKVEDFIDKKFRPEKAFR